MTTAIFSMTTIAKRKVRGRAVLLTQCVLLGTAFAWRADAAEPASGEQATRELTQPTSELEVGVGDVTQGSYKFGEYNGLQHEGAFPILNFDLSGGGLYNSDSLERWSARGADLGIDTRQLDVDYAQQGKFRIDLGYDQLRHNISDTYQTPYSGAGADQLLLPSGWLKPRVPQVNPNNLNDRALSPITGLASAVTTTGQVATPAATRPSTSFTTARSSTQTSSRSPAPTPPTRRRRPPCRARRATSSTSSTAPADTASRRARASRSPVPMGAARRMKPSSAMLRCRSACRPPRPMR